MIESFQSRQLMQGETVSVLVEDLEGLPLDWAVAMVQGKLQYLSQSLDWLAKSKEGGGLLMSKGGVYSPSRDLLTASKLMLDEAIAVRKHLTSGNWFAMYSHHLGDGEISRWCAQVVGERYGPMSYQVRMVKARFAHQDFGVAVCQCFVANHVGEEVQIPVCLFDDSVPVKASKKTKVQNTDLDA